MASNQLIAAEVAKLRRLLPTTLLAEPAPRMETATTGQVRWIRHLAFQQIALSLAARDRIRHSLHQSFRIRVAGLAKQKIGLGHLDDSTRIHHCNPMAEVFNHG